MRADLYGLGCVAYWLLTGQLVIEVPSPVAAIAAHIERQPDPPSARTELPVPPALDRIVLDCLAKDPSDRPRTAEHLAERLADVPIETAWTQAAAAHWWERHRAARRAP